MLFSSQTKFARIEKDFKELKLVNYRPVWEPFLKKYGCSYICELGIFKGDNFAQLIAHKPRLAVAVDTWNNDGAHSPTDATYSKQELNNQYQEFRNKVDGLSFVKVLKQDTVDAADQFRNNYFDLVFVDADTSLEGTYRNLKAWFPKVRYGKFLMGRNYVRGRSVALAVDRFAKEQNLKIMWRPPSIWAVVKA